MKLYIIRHGQTDANTQGIVQGWLDTELNENGLAQAKAAADSFKQSIDVIFSSDLKRAIQTAHEFLRLYENLPYFEDARLRERNFGDATGMHRDLHNWDDFWAMNDSVTIPNAEVLNDFTARVAAFLDDLRRMPYESALIVTHAGVLNRIQTILNPNHEHYAHANASILEIDF